VNISLALPENKRNFVLANLSAIDEDSGDEHVFTVDKGPPGVFTISGHQLKVCSNTIFKSLVISINLITGNTSISEGNSKIDRTLW